MKANYDVMMKNLKPDKHADKIEKMKGKKADAIKKAQEEIDLEKKERITRIKENIEFKKRELQLEKDTKLEQLQIQEQSRRKTLRLTNKSLQRQNSRGLLQTSGSSSTADISATTPATTKL